MKEIEIALPLPAGVSIQSPSATQLATAVTESIRVYPRQAAAIAAQAIWRPDKRAYFSGAATIQLREHPTCYSCKKGWPRETGAAAWTRISNAVFGGCQESLAFICTDADRRQIFATVPRCRVLHMLSRVESFGMVTIEAMRIDCLPVAWTIDTGTEAIVRQDETGLFALPGDIAALSEIVLRSIKAQPKLGLAAIKRARCNFNEETIVAPLGEPFSQNMYFDHHCCVSAGQTHLRTNTPVSSACPHTSGRLYEPG